MFSSVQFSHSVVSDSLSPHEPQHARPPCPSLTPGAYANSCPLSQWCYLNISSSAALVSAFSVSQHQDHFQWVHSLHRMAKKYWSFNFSISLSNEYSGLISFRIAWFDLLAVQGTLKSLLQHCRFENVNSSVLSFPYGPTLPSVHDYWKNHSFDLSLPYNGGKVGDNNNNTL